MVKTVAAYTKPKPAGKQYRRAQDGASAIGGGTNKRIVKATIVRAVLHFPCHPTLTVSRAPICAIHSRKADTANSRARIMLVGSAMYMQQPS